MLPAALQLEFCTTALAERCEPLQHAALRALLDPNGLNRPDVVVDGFTALVPGAVEQARQWQDELLAVARSRIVAGGDPARLAAFRVVAAIGGAGAVSLLERGIEDELQDVREVVLTALELRLREYLARSNDARADGGELPPRDEALWQALEIVLQCFGRHRHQAFLAVLGDLGQKAVAQVSRALKANPGREFVGALTTALVEAAPEPCAELALALITHKAEAVRAVGEQLLGDRQDEAFAVAFADCLVGLDANRRRAIPEATWLSTVMAVSANQRAETAERLLQIVFEETEDTTLSQQRVEAFLANPDPCVQIAALIRLRELRCPAGFAAIGKVLAGGADAVRKVAAALVLELRPADQTVLLTPLLGASDPELRRLAMREVSHDSFNRFMQRFDDMPPAARQVAACALAKIDPALVDRVGEQCSSLEPGRRLKALHIIELLDAGAALREPLIELLSDPDLKVRATAIRLVKATGSDEGIRALIDALSHPDGRIRANAIEAFEQIDDASFFELLKPFLGDRDNRVRANSAKALWNLGWAEARDTLVSMAAHADPRMRLSAVWAIAEVRFAGARKLLEQREVIESNPEVLAKVREVLAEFDHVEEDAR